MLLSQKMKEPCRMTKIAPAAEVSSSTARTPDTSTLHLTKLTGP